jgi:hypothetical protein
LLLGKCDSANVCDLLMLRTVKIHLSSILILSSGNL